MKKLLRLFFTSIGMFLLTFCGKAQDDDCYSTIQDLKLSNKTELEAKWKSINMDEGFKKLTAEVTKKGFARTKESAATPNSYGFTCKTQGGREIIKAEFYAFDFVSSDGKQACSMIWQKKGNTVYKAYVVHAKGTKDFFTSFETGDEWYADEKNEIQLARSFKKCFKKCVFKHCPAWCMGAMGGCSIAAAALLETGPGAVAFFVVCAGSFCATCLAVCAIGC